MINKKLVTLGTLFLLGVMLIVIFSQNSSAVGGYSVCCEKNNDGAWCQEEPSESDCDISGDLRSAPTSCESTFYCKLGTCVNTLEGLCMENTAQKTCVDPENTGVSAGVWYDSPSDELNQCQLGCCLIGDQASFTTQTRCKQLSSDYGLETNYRADIQTETQCIASATPNVKGACVFEEEFQRTCRFVTKQECQNLENSGTANVEFNAGLLCSAEELGTNCGQSKKTTVLDGRDEVWFVDTCGNLANIYDSDRQEDKDCVPEVTGFPDNCGYWQKIFPKALSCNPSPSTGNAKDDTCGNCDYFLGSTGKLYDKNKDGSPPNFGDYICRDLGCEDEDKEHGESWCVNSADEGFEDSPGSRWFRKICYNGDVTVEPCADYRQETCIEDSIGDFSTAACRVNKWQDCVAQDNQKDCINTDKRDCEWVESDLELIEDSCLPTHAPGFDFWKEETEAGELCLQASATCEVKFEKGALDIIGGDFGTGGKWECVENCECVGLEIGNLRDELDDINNEWSGKINNTCVALGDCGISKNYVGTDGYYELKDLVAKSEEVEE